MTGKEHSPNSSQGLFIFWYFTFFRPETHTRSSYYTLSSLYENVHIWNEFELTRSGGFTHIQRETFKGSSITCDIFLNNMIIESKYKSSHLRKKNLGDNPTSCGRNWRRGRPHLLPSLQKFTERVCNRCLSNNSNVTVSQKQIFRIGLHFQFDSRSSSGWRPRTREFNWNYQIYKVCDKR